MKRLARYVLRPPVSLERLHWEEGSDQVAYTRKPRSGRPGATEHIDALDFLARLMAFIPEPTHGLLLWLAEQCLSRKAETGPRSRAGHARRERRD